MVLHILIGACLLAGPQAPYDNLADALRAREASRGGLPEDAVQYVINKCGLGWMTGWPEAHERYWTDVRGYVSSNRKYCLLSPAGAAEWGQGGPTEYCLVDADSGALWLLSASDVLQLPVVSNVGMVALYNRGCTPKSVNHDPWTHQLVELSIVDVRGDTLVTETWWDHRPYGGLDQAGGFSPEGQIFMQTMNLFGEDPTRVAGKSTTLLYWYDFETNEKRIEELGRFHAGELEISGVDAFLWGTWGARAVLGERYDEGFYHVTWNPWRIEKVVELSHPSR